MNRQNPDLIFLGGDYVEGKAENILDIAPILKKLDAPLGRFAVLGNHDYWTDAATITAALNGIGIPVLKNRSVPIVKNGKRFHVTGLDDAWEGRPRLRKALDGVPKEEIKLFLVHEPDYADKLTRFESRIPLQLSGHSHGGQVRVPIYGAPVLPFLAKKYSQGLYTVTGTSRQIYTTRGVGGIAPLRFNCRPEVTILDLAG